MLFRLEGLLISSSVSSGTISPRALRGPGPLLLNVSQCEAEFISAGVDLFNLVKTIRTTALNHSTNNSGQHRYLVLSRNLITADPRALQDCEELCGGGVFSIRYFWLSLGFCYGWQILLSTNSIQRFCADLQKLGDQRSPSSFSGILSRVANLVCDRWDLVVGLLLVAPTAATLCEDLREFDHLHVLQWIYMIIPKYIWARSGNLIDLVTCKVSRASQQWSK